MLLYRHQQFMINSDSPYFGRVDPVRKITIQLHDTVVECQEKQEIISLSSWEMLEECPFCDAPTGYVTKRFSPLHTQLILPPDSDLVGRLDPVRRIALIPGHVIVLCLQKGEVMTRESWDALERCSFCGANSLDAKLVSVNISHNWPFKLRAAMIDSFDRGEINTLCFDLLIDYDELSGHKDLPSSYEGRRYLFPWSIVFLTVLTILIMIFLFYLLSMGYGG